jgi:hypothetical protein
MNKSISKFAVWILAITLALSSAAGARTDCETVKGSGHTFATGPFTFQGTAVFTIAGETSNVSVTTNLLGPPGATDDGTLHARTSHVFVFADGSSIVTLDNAVLSPTETPGLYNLSSRLEIIGGTGVYENACGSFTGGGGSINLIAGEAIWRFTGRICTCG